MQDILTEQVYNAGEHNLFRAPVILPGTIFAFKVEHVMGFSKTSKSSNKLSVEYNLEQNWLVQSQFPKI